VLGYPLDSETLCLQISDDGKGMTEEDCRALMRRLDEENGERAIGLRNVHRRLRLRYGAKYGVTIRSIPDESTVVTLTLPIEFEKETS
ncbi:MAG: sensor histidine kinase, partial [Clostridia bacterium]|nr:sensor histidine kinase [Clostridia bacterium]